MNETRAVFSSVEHMLHRRIMMYAFDFCYSLLEQFEYFFWGGGGMSRWTICYAFFRTRLTIMQRRGSGHKNFGGIEMKRDPKNVGKHWTRE